MCWTRNYDGGRGSWEAMDDGCVCVERCVGGPAGMGRRRVFRSSRHGTWVEVRLEQSVEVPGGMS